MNRKKVKKFAMTVKPLLAKAGTWMPVYLPSIDWDSSDDVYEAYYICLLYEIEKVVLNLPGIALQLERSEVHRVTSLIRGLEKFVKIDVD